MIITASLLTLLKVKIIALNQSSSKKDHFLLPNPRRYTRGVEV
jgi:hypothetical protein